MTPTGKRRLLKLADILDVADAEHRKKKEPTYDQHAIAHDCGTPACALGHWAANNPRRLKIEDTSWDDVGIKFRGEEDYPTIEEIAQREFGIYREEGAELFGYSGCGEARTAKQAARYIRKFVKRVEKKQKAAA